MNCRIFTGEDSCSPRGKGMPEVLNDWGNISIAGKTGWKILLLVVRVDGDESN